MRGYGNAARYQAQSGFAATAAVAVRAASDSAAQAEALSSVTGGASDTIQALRDELDSHEARLDAIGA